MADYFNSPNAGQNRRAWLNGLLGSIGDSADYYLGPTGVPDRTRSAGQLVDMVSPVSGTLRSMNAAGRGDYAESALEGVGVLAPAAIAAKFGAPAARAVVETMTGTGNALADTGSRAYQDVISRLNQTGDMGTLYSNPLAAPFDMMRSASDHAVDTRVPYQRDGTAVARQISNIPSAKSVIGVEDLPPAGNFTKITPLQSRALPEHQSAGYLSDEIVPPRVQQSIAPLLGRDVMAIVGDQTGRHTVTSVDGKVLPNEVASKAGFQYIDVPGQGYAGASSATSSKATEAGRPTTRDPYYMSFMMGEQSGDFARHQGNIFGEMFKSAPIAASNVTKVDEAIRKIGVPKTVKVFDDNGNPVMNPKTGKQKTKSVKSFPFTNFGTVADPNAVSAYIDAIPTGTQRAYFLKGMDTDAFQKMGVPRVSDARLAAADPNQIGMDWGTVGYRGFTPDLERGLYPTTPAQSTTYDTGIGKVGQADTFLEGSRGIPANLLYRDLAEAQRAKGTGGGLLMNSADYKAYEMSPKRAKQTIDDLAVETVDTFLEIEKRGGRGDALRYARDILSGGKVTGAMVEAARKANAPTWVIAAMATSAGLSAATQPTQRPGLLSDI